MFFVSKSALCAPYEVLMILTRSKYGYREMIWLLYWTSSSNYTCLHQFVPIECPVWSALDLHTFSAYELLSQMQSGMLENEWNKSDIHPVSLVFHFLWLAHKFLMYLIRKWLMLVLFHFLQQARLAILRLKEINLINEPR